MKTVAWAIMFAAFILSEAIESHARGGVPLSKEAMIQNGGFALILLIGFLTCAAIEGR